MRPSIPVEYENYLAVHGYTEMECWIPGFDSYGDFVPWTLSELGETNDDYGFDEFAPGYVGFGSNGAGELYVFDAHGAVFLMQACSLGPKDALPVAASFNEMLKGLRGMSC